MKISHLTQTHWASYKYLVMAHSQVEYNYIRKLFKGNEWSPLKETSYQAALTRALNKPADNNLPSSLFTKNKTLI